MCDCNIETCDFNFYIYFNKMANLSRETLKLTFE